MTSVEEAREAYEAAIKSEAVRAAREALGEALCADAMSHLEESYELIYVDRDDRLSEKQVAALVKGDLETLWELLDEWEADSRYYSIDFVVRNLIDDHDLELVRRTKAYQSLTEAIAERDNSDWLRDLIRNTPDPLLRIECIDEDSAFSFEAVSPEQVLERIGFEVTEHNRAVIARTLDECSPEFSTLIGYWLCTIDLQVLLNCPEDGSIKITKPILYLSNPFGGSGWFDEEALHGEVVVKRSDIRTDKDAFGYSADEVFGGLSPSNFEVKAEIVVEADEAEDPRR